MLFVTILIILLATKIAGDLCVRIGQPAVLGKLAIGIVIGPAVLGWIEPSETIEQLSQIGVLLLMFIAGLETNVKDLNANRNASFAVATGGIVFPLFLGYATGLLFGMEQEHAVFLGLVLSATSVSISVQTLKDLGLLRSRESTALLGAAILDDILVVILLAFVMSFIGGQDISLPLVIGKKLLFFAIAGLMIWKGTKWIMRFLAPLRVSEPVMSAAIITCFFFAYVAKTFEVAEIIGAFAAGLAVSQTKYKKEIEQKIEPIAYTVFVPIFFVSIGLSVSFQGLGGQIGFIAVLGVVAVVSKLIGSGLGARLTGFSPRSSVGIGSGMISRGEVALIIAVIGLESKLLAPQYFTSVVLVVILTTLVTPLLLKFVFVNNKGTGLITDADQPPQTSEAK